MHYINSAGTVKLFTARATGEQNQSKAEGRGVGYVIFKTNTPTHQPFFMCFQHLISKVVHSSGRQPGQAALYF